MQELLPQINEMLESRTTQKEIEDKLGFAGYPFLYFYEIINKMWEM